MDLRRLRLFVAVAEHGGFTAAAEAEHVAQPAVSLAIRELEQELGAPLFTRSRAGATPHRGRRGAAGPGPAGAPRRRARRRGRGGGHRAGGRAPRPRLPPHPRRRPGGRAGRPLPSRAPWRDGADGRAAGPRGAGRRRAHRRRRGGHHRAGPGQRRPRGDHDRRAGAVRRRPAGRARPARCASIASTASRSCSAPPGRRCATPSTSPWRRPGVRPDIGVETAQRDALIPLVLAGAGTTFLPDTLARAAGRLGATVRPTSPRLRRTIVLVHRPGDPGPAATRFLELALTRLGHRVPKPTAGLSHPSGTLGAWLFGGSARARCGARGPTWPRTARTSPTSSSARSSRAPGWWPSRSSSSRSSTARWPTATATRSSAGPSSSRPSRWSRCSSPSGGGSCSPCCPPASRRTSATTSTPSSSASTWASTTAGSRASSCRGR